MGATGQEQLGCKYTNLSRLFENPRSASRNRNEAVTTCQAAQNSPKGNNCPVLTFVETGWHFPPREASVYPKFRTEQVTFAVWVTTSDLHWSFDDV